MKSAPLFLILFVNLLYGCNSHERVYTKKNLYDLKTVRQICEGMKDEQDLRYFKAHVVSRASRAGCLDIVRYIIETGDVDLNRPYVSGGQTPLQYAIEHDHMEIFKLLLENGADANRETTLFSTPLIWAVRSGDLRKVELLLEYGADVNKVSNDITALHVATAIGTPSIIRFLLSKGADVNIDSSCGCRPIHVAAWCDRLEAAKILLENGADQTVKCDGHTVGEIARSDEFRKLLQNYDQTQKH